MYKRNQLYNIFIFLQFALLICNPINAANGEPFTIRYHKPKSEFYAKLLGGAWTIFVSGEIDADSSIKLENFLTSNKVPIRSEVVLNSPGGNLYAGLEIGRVIRKHYLNTRVGIRVKPKDPANDYDIVPGGCYSSCTYAYLGGVFRYLNDGSHYGVHRFYTINPNAGNMDTAQVTSAQIVSYIREMGVDPDLFTLSTRAGADEIFEPSISILHKFNVVNDGWGPTNWTVESRSGFIYLKGERDTQYGMNKLIFNCMPNVGMTITAIFDPQGREDEVTKMTARSLVIDEKDEPIDMLSQDMSNVLYNSTYPLTDNNIDKIKNAKTIGIILRWTYEAPVFLGIFAMPFHEAADKLNGILNTCRR